MARIEVVKVNIVAGLCNYAHSEAGVDSYVFKVNIRAVLAEKRATETAGVIENHPVAYGGITHDTVNAELVISDVLKFQEVGTLPEWRIVRAVFELTGFGAKFDGACNGEGTRIVSLSKLTASGYKELIRAKLLFKIDITVSVRNYACLHKAGFGIFKCKIPDGYIL